MTWTLCLSIEEVILNMFDCRSKLNDSTIRQVLTEAAKVPSAWEGKLSTCARLHRIACSHLTWMWCMTWLWYNDNDIALLHDIDKGVCMIMKYALRLSSDTLHTESYGWSGLQSVAHSDVGHLYVGQWQEEEGEVGIDSQVRSGGCIASSGMVLHMHCIWKANANLLQLHRHFNESTVKHIDKW